MVTKYKYSLNNGKVTRVAEYSFTGVENLIERLSGIDNQKVINSIANTTLKGEAERELIGVEDAWFKAQSDLQKMDAEREILELKLKNGDKNGNPLTPDVQTNIKARIAECTEGTITIEKEFYDHYTRETHKVKEVHQTPYTIALELRNDLESNNGYLAGFRGVTSAPARPETKLNIDKEQAIKKILVRQEINIQVGDDKDLIADMSHALTSLIKQINGENLSSDDSKAINKYVERQNIISDILSSDYK